jgi:hypothetical protein
VFKTKRNALGWELLFTSGDDNRFLAVISESMKYFLGKSIVFVLSGCGGIRLRSQYVIEINVTGLPNHDCWLSENEWMTVECHNRVYDP